MARDVGKSQVIRAALCAKARAWPSSNNKKLGNHWELSRHRSDMV